MDPASSMVIGVLRLTERHVPGIATCILIDPLDERWWPEVRYVDWISTLEREGAWFGDVT